jgi:oligosaccharide reducing-end xylanase
LRGKRPSPIAVLLVPLACALLGACGSTTDSLGYDRPRSTFPLTPLATRNVLFDWLNKQPLEIDTKINNAWNQLFHGDPGTQAIYFEVGTNEAEIRDILHNNDIRTEGFGYAMMIAVQLDKRTEFDRLWAYAKAKLRYAMTEPGGGYFQSSCDRVPPQGPTSCSDPFGHAQFVTALLFAKDRWGITGTHDYEADALELLDVMRHKEDINDGIVNDVTNTFDLETALPFDLPEVARAGVSRPSIVMPAFYELWAQATLDPFWKRAAEAGRAYWKRTAHPMTGLMPVRAEFDGTPVANWATFDAESYRTMFNMALDWHWFAHDPWQIEEADMMLDFFTFKGMDDYGTSYTLEGTVVETYHEPALVITNGVSASISNNVNRIPYVQQAWSQLTPIGPPRYFTGLLHLNALLILSGRFRVW